MSYTLKFSDPTKLTDVTVPDMPPGINTVDTSLSLVGRGYPNYGEKIAQNFLYLLENFASALPPENPIEGQLWYDTSDPTNKVLRIMDGTATATRWPSATGIYQQATNPKETASAGLKVGDIWVDTASNQLKIYNSNDWTLVGPQTSGSLTGPTPEQIEDNLDPPSQHYVIKNYVDGVVVSVISADTFTPREVIPGFTSLRKGVNVISSGLFNGTAFAAQTLDIGGLKYSSSNFLRKNDSGSGQVITGRVVFSTPTNQSGSQGRDGIIINSGVTAEYIQLYKYSNDAVLLNNKSGGKILLQTKPAYNDTLGTTVTIESGKVGINTGTNTLSPTLDVYGNVRVLSTLTVSSADNAAISVAGGISVGSNLLVANNLSVSGITTSTGVLRLGTTTGSGSAIIPNNTGTYDLGSAAMPFRSLYVSSIASIGTGTVIYGSINGTAAGLKYSSTFRLQGQVTATSFTFAGTGTEATFNASLTRTAISSQTSVTTASSTMNLLVLDESTSTSSLSKISRSNFLADVSFSGMITAYGGSTAPTGWLLCDGSTYSSTVYPDLYAVIGYSYGGSSGSFNVPDLDTATVATGGHPVAYIIKT